MSETVSLKIIGTIRSEHVVTAETPIAPSFAKGCQGRVEVLPEYEEGLNDIEGFSHLILLWHLHLAGPGSLIARPPFDGKERGVFATRSPRRPNPIGLSIVRLVRREGRTLFVEDVDMQDGTPLLDIKPYTERFDSREELRNGWLDSIDEETARERAQRNRPSAGKPDSER